MNDLQSLGWLDGLQEAVWVLDEASQHILQANAGAERLTGLSAAAMRGRSVLDLASTPQELAFWSEPVDVIAQGVTAHTSLLRADGSLVPVQRCVRRVPWGEGGSTVLLLTMLDRSLQETTERELETLLSELRATLDSAADGMLVCGLDRRVRAFNQRLAQLWNLPRQFLVERDDAAVYAFMADQVSDPRFYAERLAAIDREPMQESTDIVELRNGVVLEMRTVPQFSQGRAVGRVYSFRDITRQTETQASLRLAARVFESSLDAIFIADSQHRIMRMNPGCERLVGPTAKGFEGCVAASLFGGGSDASFMEQVLQGWAKDGFWEGELWLPRDNGAYCAVQLSWVALRDDEGRLVQSIGFMRDLTLQHAAQKRIEELAYSDALTGLPNRLLLSQRVDTAIQGRAKAIPALRSCSWTWTASRSSTTPWGTLLETGCCSWWLNACRPACGKPTCCAVWAGMNLSSTCMGVMHRWPKVWRAGFWTTCSSPSCSTAWASRSSAVSASRCTRRMAPRWTT